MRSLSGCLVGQPTLLLVLVRAPQSLAFRAVKLLNYSPSLYSLHPKDFLDFNLFII
eukprot:SAG11_NODE_15443_length_578_cov_0.960334_1_plen_55_part_10